MSVTGTDIRLRAPSAPRAFVLAALLIATLAAGILIGRQITPSAPIRSSAVVATVPTTWLDGTPTVRSEVMQAMNSLDAAVSPRLDTTSTGGTALQHMNRLATATDGSRASTAIRVMREMNELATGSRSS